MKLDIVAPEGGFEIYRNGNFSDLGFTRSHGTDLLVPLYDKAYLRELTENPNISAAITTRELAPEVPSNCAVGISEKPMESLFDVHSFLCGLPDFYCVPFDTRIDESAILHPTAYVAERNVRIGHGTKIGPNATIMENTILGDHVVIRAGCVIGEPGLQVRTINGQCVAIEHMGGVKIDDRVEVQANSVINRSLFGGHTLIGAETKIGSLVDIAHNAQIGKRCRIIDSAMIAGSAILSDDVWISPGVTVGRGVMVGAGSIIGANSFVKTDIPPGVRAWGNPAQVRP